MAAKNSTGDRRPVAPSPDKLLSPRTGDAPPDRNLNDSSRMSALLGTIEDERDRLMTAEALVACVLAAMESYDAGDPDGPCYSAVLELARDILSESLDKLDSAKLKPMIRELVAAPA